MLKMAVTARLPLIRVESDDPVNIGTVLEELVGVGVAEAKLATLAKKIPTLKVGSVTYLMGSDKLDPTVLYEAFANRGATLIVVNPPRHNAYFDAGFVTAPKKMIQQFVMKHALQDHEQITDALTGLSFKQAVEISKLAMSESGSFTARAVQKVRRQYYGTLRGLEQVGDCSQLYQPHTALMDWVKLNSAFMFKSINPLFRSKGLLFNGPPGTGKTEGAKFLAMVVKQPLYRMNIGSLMSKWAGESEHNLDAALRQAENCAPCVLLFDEVEKLFKVGEDGGVSTRLLATLLWWLQEHQSQVFTVMTTNEFAAIPPELIRPGRIDKVMEFPLLGHMQVKKFLESLLGQLASIHTLLTYEHDALLNDLLMGPDQKSHAEVVGMTIEALKKSVLDKAEAEG